MNAVNCLIIVNEPKTYQVFFSFIKINIVYFEVQILHFLYQPLVCTQTVHQLQEYFVRPFHQNIIKNSFNMHFMTIIPLQSFVFNGQSLSIIHFNLNVLFNDPLPIKLASISVLSLHTVYNPYIFRQTKTYLL